MFNFGMDMGRGNELPPPYIAKIRIEVRGKLSSYTRGGGFEMFETDTSPALVEGVDFSLSEKLGITYSDANLKSFLDGNNPSAEIVSTNGNGYMELTFIPETLFSMDRLTIQGRTSAASTQFKMVIFDNHGHTLYSKGLVPVQAKEIWSVGIDL